MKWMDRLKKNSKAPEEGATKTTKTPPEILESPKHGGYENYENPKNGQKGVFVVFVASPDSAFQKNEGATAPKPETRQKGVFVGFVASPDKDSGKNAKPMPPTTPPPPKPTPPFSVHAPWNVADNAYQNHHWQCQQCRVNARTRDREPRCAIGQELYTAYELAAMKAGTPHPR